MKLDLPKGAPVLSSSRNSTMSSLRGFDATSIRLIFPFVPVRGMPADPGPPCLLPSEKLSLRGARELISEEGGDTAWALGVAGTVRHSPKQDKRQTDGGSKLALSRCRKNEREQGAKNACCGWRSGEAYLWIAEWEPCSFDLPLSPCSQCRALLS